MMRVERRVLDRAATRVDRSHPCGIDEEAGVGRHRKHHIVDLGLVPVHPPGRLKGAELEDLRVCGWVTDAWLDGCVTQVRTVCVAVKFCACSVRAGMAFSSMVCDRFCQRNVRISIPCGASVSACDCQSHERLAFSYSANAARRPLGVVCRQNSFCVFDSNLPDSLVSSDVGAMLFESFGYCLM